MDHPALPDALIRLPAPPSSELLGWSLRALDPEQGTIEVGFVADRRFTNPAGNVQGGFIAAMLDDTQGPALFAKSGGQYYAPTVDFGISFLRPAFPGRFVGRGRVVSLGRTIAFTEADLFDEQGELIARARFTCRVVAASRAFARQEEKD